MIRWLTHLLNEWLIDKRNQTFSLPQLSLLQKNARRVSPSTFYPSHFSIKQNTIKSWREIDGSGKHIQHTKNNKNCTCFVFLKVFWISHLVRNLEHMVFTRENWLFHETMFKIQKNCSFFVFLSFFKADFQKKYKKTTVSLYF